MGNCPEKGHSGVPCMVGVAGSILLAVASAGVAASSPERDRVDAALRPRGLRALRLLGPAPKIDGRLDEPAWAAAETASDLVQRRPDPGALATLRTEIRVLHDDAALFVGVRLLDPSPERIAAPYARRDDYILSDWVFVELDSRHDRRTAFSFGLNPRGVQVDGAFFDDVEYDLAWNAVWESAAQISGEGWEAEYRIPFSQLAYSVEGAGAADSALAVWGLNVYRSNPSRGEVSNWSPRLPSRAGIVSNFNDLALHVPSRRASLEATPYVAVTRARDTSTSGGVDLRAGVGSAFTLTAAVHPDFGQLEADPSEVNLTTFETAFTERRPLFVESAGLFAFDLGLPLATRGNSFATEQAFYSRRIGRPPRLPLPDPATEAEVPGSATLLGAARLTGRTSAGWSVGGLLALTGRETAEFANASGHAESLRVEPFTEYGVARVSKDFRSGASAVGAVGTFVGRSGTTPDLEALLPRRVFAAGVDARHRFRGDEYEATGFLLGSRIEATPEAIARVLHGPGHFAQRPDARHLDFDGTASSASGFAGQARLARIGGEHWRWALAGRVMSPFLELNDVGFQRNSDLRVAFGSLTYQHERPGVLRRWTVGTKQVGWGWSFGGERRAAVLNLSASADLRNYWGGSVSLDHELPALQVEALRGGPALLLPSRDSASVSLYTDTRRQSQVRLDLRGFREPATASHQLAVAPAIDVRASDRLSFSLGPSIEWTSNAWQYVESPVAAGHAHHLLARLEQTTASLTTRVDLAFSPRLTLQLYAQPFASRGDFGQYKEVIAPRASRVAERVRSLSPDDVTGGAGNLGFDFGADGAAFVRDPSYRIRDLNVNVVLRWEHRPGSALFVVWTQDRHGAPTADSSFAPVRDLFGVSGTKPNNTVLVKLSYWLAGRN